MPYRRVGKKVMHKKNGWKEKQTAGSVAKAKRTMNLLHGIEHGWEPTGRKAKDLRGKAAKQRAKGRR